MNSGRDQLSLTTRYSDCYGKQAINPFNSIFLKILNNNLKHSLILNFLSVTPALPTYAGHQRFSNGRGRRARGRTDISSYIVNFYHTAILGLFNTKFDF